MVRTAPDRRSCSCPDRDPSWYKRSEFGIRSALFFSAATVSGAFGGLLAAAIAKMDGVGGYPAWSWIFILEGLATVVAGVLSFWIIQGQEQRFFRLKNKLADSHAQTSPTRPSSFQRKSVLLSSGGFSPTTSSLQLANHSSLSTSGLRSRTRRCGWAVSPSS